MRLSTLLKALPLVAAMSILVAPIASAIPIVPAAIDWSVTTSVVVSRPSGAPNTSITDIAGGVNLHFDAPTGGSGAGTATRRYDFETTAAASGGAVSLSIDLNDNSFLGFFKEDFGLQIMKNGAMPMTNGGPPPPTLLNITTVMIACIRIRPTNRPGERSAVVSCRHNSGPAPSSHGGIGSPRFGFGGGVGPSLPAAIVGPPRRR